MWDSGALAEADLTAGRYIMAGDMPRILLPTGTNPGKQALPRFLRLQYVTVGTHTAGGIFGTIVLDRQDQVAYPAGITVSN
jgi:hypothetical protein